MRIVWRKLLEFGRFVTAIEPDPQEVRTRIRRMELNLGLPVRVVVMCLLFYYLFLSNWFESLQVGGNVEADIPPREMVMDRVRWVFLGYLVLNVGFASLLLGMRHLPSMWLLRIVFVMEWIDAMFLAALTIATGGFESILYWVFLGMIVRNAISTPEAARQVATNLFVTLSYLLAGLANLMILSWERPLLDEKVLMALGQISEGAGTEPFLLRTALLGLMTFCCAGVELLLSKQRLAEGEAREFALRQQQFEATGRLAAEIAHQLKNPLGIINNAAFTLQRTVREGKTITQQILMIREEVERSDRIITELMGYARLTEGRAEKLDVCDVLNNAVGQVFPDAAKYEVVVERDYQRVLPALLMQRSHLSEVFMNLLGNARDAMNARGTIRLSVKSGEDHSVVISIADSGPGIPVDKLPKIFEPYFTTKEKGSGLGLAIVKHNTEIYGGTVEVESELGKGTCFTIKLPSRTLVKIRK